VLNPWRTNVDPMVHATKIMPTGSERHRQRKPPRFRLNRALHVCVDWLVAGPRAQPCDIRNQLLHQSLTKKRTLIVSVVATSLMASVAAVLTAAPWAYAWLLAELLIGGIRISLMSAFAKADPSRRNRTVIAPVLAGLAAFVVVSTAGYQCVGSGQWVLIAMAGMGLASLVGAVSSRNAGTPRYGFLLICILTAPFSLASLISPIPHLFILGIELPLYACGVIFVMLENYKVLLNLYGSERENRKLAQYDPLTGLPNRIMNLKRFDELLAGAPAPSDEMQKVLTVFCLDLDGFKDVNDRYGHAAGDALLIALADRLRDCVRTLDFVSRIGGDEFVILLPAISPAEATIIAKRIIACVEAPFDVGLPALVHVGISIGSACAPDDGKTADALLRSADRAMYEAKRRGKGVFVTLNGLEVEPVELAPAADADALTAEIFG
jgi:diguanylate cyclase (GGDEF)-like protein